jgi:preprotein translocase subunit Sec61beta
VKPSITPDLVIGTCVLIALVFVFWLFDQDS